MAYASRKRRGMGDLPPCSSVQVAPGFVGPVECDPSAGPVSYPASQSQVADIWAALQNMGSGGAAAAQPIPWGTIAMVGGGVFVVLLLLGRR